MVKIFPQTSVIIVNYNFGDFLIDCLKSIDDRRNRSLDLLEIIVVDNGSTDGSISNAQKQFPDVKYIINDKNLGFARACNIGVEQTTGEFLLFLNPDTVVVNGAIKKAEDFMATHPECGALSGLIFNPDGSRQPTVRRFPTYTNILFGRYAPFTKVFPNNRFSRDYLCADLDYSQPQVVDALCGAFFFVRQRAWAEVGGFDERFFFMVEDTDLCYRFKENGWQVSYFPQPVCVHHLGERIKPNRKREKFYHSLGMYRFYEKHYQPNIFLKVLLNFALLLRIVSITTFGI